MNQDVFWMHFEERKSQQISRVSVFVRKRVIFKFELVSSDAIYHIYMQISNLKLWRSMQFHAFLCRFQISNCIDRCNLAHVYANCKCEFLSFDLIRTKIILHRFQALFRDLLYSNVRNGCLQLAFWLWQGWIIYDCFSAHIEKKLTST